VEEAKDAEAGGKTRTPTELVMHVLEDFGECEAKEAIVIWTDRSGGLNWSATTDSLTARIGMIELTKAYMLRRLPED